MFRGVVTFIAWCLLSATAVTPAHSTDFVINGSFDADIGGWVPPHPIDGITEWDSLDVDESLYSGSLRFTNITPHAFSALTTQCLPVTQGNTYSAGSMIFIPTGQASEGFAYLDIRWKENADCSGNGLDNAATTVAFPAATWQSKTVSTVTAPAGSHGVRVRLIVYKSTSGGEFLAFFDDVFLDDHRIFADGFESGDSDRWSVAVPE